MIKKVTLGIAQAAFWLVVSAGCLLVAYSLAALNMLRLGAQPGDPIYLDTLAPTWTEAFFDLSYGLVLIGVPFAIRFGVRRWLHLRRPTVV